MKKLLWVTLLVLFSLQTNSSYSLELNLKIPKDLKTLGDKVKKELEKKEPKVKEEEVKTEEVKTEEVKTEEVKTEEVKDYKVVVEKVEENMYRGLKQTDERVIVLVWTEVMYWHAIHIRERKIKSSKLPNCKANSHGHVSFDLCYGYRLMDQGTDEIYGNDEHHEYEGEFENGKPNGMGIFIIKDKNGNVTEVLQGIWRNWELISAGNVSDPEFSAKNLNSKAQKCEEYKSNPKKYQNSKTPSGYQDFYFGMPENEVIGFIECKIKENNNIFYKDISADAAFNGFHYIINDLYNKNKIYIKFDNDKKVNRIIIEFVKHFTKQVKVYSKSLGVEEFDQLKKAVSQKYDLLIEPTKNFIAEFNADLQSSEKLTWVFKNNVSDNIILLVLERDFIKVTQKFIFSSHIHYLSVEESKIYKDKSESKVIKSDDL